MTAHRAGRRRLWLFGLWLSAQLVRTGSCAGAAGDPDPTFDAGPLPADPFGSTINFLLVQSDDRIVLGGTFTSFQGLEAPSLVRLLPSGELDPGYRPDLTSGMRLAGRLAIRSLILLPGDRLVVDAPGLSDRNGAIDPTTGARDSSPACLLPDGMRDPSFISGARLPNGAPLAGPLQFLAGQRTGEILVQNGGLRGLTASGVVDTHWPSNNGEPVVPGFFSSAAVQSNGRILAFGQWGGTGRRDIGLDRLRALDTNGVVDARFPVWQPIATGGRYGTADQATIRCILIEPDDKILLCGTFSWLSDGTNIFPCGSIARLNADGTLDPSFDARVGFNDVYFYPDIPQWNATNSRSVFAAALASDGRIIASGSFNGYAGIARPNLARLNPDGSLDTTFAPPAPARWITRVAVQTDGKVLASAGTTLETAGRPPFAGGRGIVRLNGGPLVPSAPSITLQPADQAITLPLAAGAAITFSIAALSAQPPTFRWYHNGAPIEEGSSASAQVHSEGNSSSLTLLDPNQAAAGRYECAVANAGGSVLSSSAFLAINGSTSPVPDAVPPLLTVSSPATVLLRTVTNTVTFRGAANDNVGLARVLVQKGDGPFQPVSGLGAWSARFDLDGGTNLFRFKAVDLAGNASSLGTRIVVYVINKGFVLHINGGGEVARPSLGNSLEAGRTYTLRATAKPGNVFSNWISAGISYADPTFTWVMRDDLEITANFVPNPFPAVAGAYSGLIFHPIDPRHEDSGAFELQTDDNGGCKGRVIVAGETLSVRGRLDLNRQARLNLELPDGRPAALSLQMDNDAMTGALETGGRTNVLSGHRPGFSQAHPFAARPSQQTLLLSSEGPSGALLPTGHGFATLAISRTGRANLKGILADDTRWAQAGSVSATGRFAVYDAFPNGHGSFFGWLTLSASNTTGVCGTLFRARPGAATQALAVLGSPYQPPARGEPILDFVDAVVIRQGGGLTAPATNAIRLDARQHITVLGLNPDRLALVIKPGTGVIDGRFVHPATGRPANVKGVVLPRLSAGGGFFFSSGAGGALYLGPLDRYPLFPPMAEP